MKRKKTNIQNEFALSRRRFLFLTGAASTAILASTGAGCNYFPVEEGDAFAPWQWPAKDNRPAYIAVGAAILAANPHNSQPWLFDISQNQIDVHADLNKSLGVIDGFHREMYMGLGCALENMRLSAESFGNNSTLTILPNTDETHIARVHILGGQPVVPPEFLKCIPRRHTNRGMYMKQMPPPQLGEDLNALIEDSEVNLKFISDVKTKAEFRRGVIDATREITKDKEMNNASHHWWRQTEEAIDVHRDGLTADAAGIGATLRFFTKSGSNPSAEKAGKYWLKNTEETQTYCSAFGVLSTRDRNSRREQILCGQTLQRIYLFATQNGLAVQPLNQMPERMDREILQGLNPEFGNRLSAFVDDEMWHPQVVFRIGYAWDNAFKSPRRPIEWVMK